MLTMDLSHGGHLTHGNKANFSGKFFRFSTRRAARTTNGLIYDQLAQNGARTQAEDDHPSAPARYPRTIDLKRMGEIAREVAALSADADIAHIRRTPSVTECIPTPIPHADFVTTTTIKPCAGPRGGLIMREKHAKE